MQLETVSCLSNHTASQAGRQHNTALSWLTHRVVDRADVVKTHTLNRGRRRTAELIRFLPVTV